MCISAYLLPSAVRGYSPPSPLSSPVPHKSTRYLRFYSIIWYSHSLTFATTAGTQLVLEIWNLIPGPQYIHTYFACLCMCFTADHKSCVNQVRYIYVHRYIFMSLCSTWPRFMYVKPLVVASILDYFDVSLHRFTVACEKTVSLHSVSNLQLTPVPLCPSSPFVRTTVNLKPEREREGGEKLWASERG